MSLSIVIHVLTFDLIKNKPYHKKGHNKIPFLVKPTVHLVRYSLTYGRDQKQGASGLPTREVDYGSGQTGILSLKSSLLLPLLELPHVPPTSRCRRCRTGTLKIQIHSCADQRETTGIKGPSVQPKNAFRFLAVLWSIMKVHANQGKTHSRYTVQDLKSGGFSSIGTFFPCF